MRLKQLAVLTLITSIFTASIAAQEPVDAALDEANIGRFTAVIKEFSSLSQFIVVTHSKKTMSAGDVIYGITMQESGISKRVSVRFDDWPEGRAAA